MGQREDAGRAREHVAERLLDLLRLDDPHAWRLYAIEEVAFIVSLLIGDGRHLEAAALSDALSARAVDILDRTAPPSTSEMAEASRWP